MAEYARFAPKRPLPEMPAKPIKMVVLGDSLSAGLGLPEPDRRFPTRLQKALGKTRG